MPPTPAFLGVDIGTSSSKGVLVLGDGSVVRTAVREHAVSRPAAGHVEMDAEIWWREFVELATELSDGFDIQAVGVSGMGPCVLLADDAGEPVRPAILYGVDTRAGKQIAALDTELGAAAIFDRCGSRLSSQAVGPKLRWIAENEPEAWQRARRLFMPASWLAYRLTGEYVLDYHSASQCTPLFDTGTLEWIPEWSGAAGHLELPPLRWPGEEAGRVREAVGGIRAGTPVITGTIDAWSEALSVDAQNPGDLMLMYGTTMFLIATGAHRLTDERLWGTVGATPGTYNLAGGMATSGAVTDWFRGLTDQDFPQLVAEAAASPPGANGLVMLPYFAGERTPIFDPDARGVIAGLTLSHTRGDLYRAILEATACGVRHNVEAITGAGVTLDRIVAVGGGTRGGLWAQIVSDVSGLPQIIPSHTVGASFGAAALAAGLVVDVDLARWNPPAVHVEPDPAVRDDYDDLYDLYRALYPATQAVAHRLAARQAQKDRP